MVFNYAVCIIDYKAEGNDRFYDNVQRRKYRMLMESVQGALARLLLRVMVGLVFLSEGLQKFIVPDKVGVGRFITIGIPAPEIMAPFVAVTEILCALLLLTGVVTRAAVLPLILIMLVAIVSTKIPILVHEGFWSMAHAARNDWSMLLGCVVILLLGPGEWRLASLLDSRRSQ
jgi:putative oxidoreductase